ncbi:hypothetical protein GQ457_08G005620 [Hibiscus cannabinus]
MKHPHSSLPPGFRFHPTDEELILHYLMKKLSSSPFSVSIIADVDIYKSDPWDLPDKAVFGEKECHRPLNSKDGSMRLDDWVLCRIYKKSHALSSTSAAAAANGQVAEEDALLPALESPSANNINNIISLQPQKSSSFSNLLDAMDYSMLSSFLADNQCNTIGYESSYFGFRNIEQPPVSSDGSRLLEKLPQLSSSVPSMENKLKRQCSSNDENYSEPSKKHIGSCSHTKSTNQFDVTQYNLLNQSFFDHTLLLNHHFQF